MRIIYVHERRRGLAGRCALAGFLAFQVFFITLAMAGGSWAAPMHEAASQISQITEFPWLDLPGSDQLWSWVAGSLILAALALMTRGRVKAHRTVAPDVSLQTLFRLRTGG
ncbi:hypothetical protein EOD42_14600 [Rhodovarius crocodyli]|uniref:Uncharacterized protein n=1 Tax=Rhodovarius crocodyli TaxID=1979269 RepID=A0A437MFD7_9PROT|nr:hypothetical protein [Rhodovarius crocodyli]RVT96335.1 hypothetical protein EOD42_14600 [Rhodovarius crocodyli]